MKAGNARRANMDVSKALGQIGIGKAARTTKLSNQRLSQIGTTLYLHQLICSSGVIELRGKGLRLFAERLDRNREYYDKSCPAHSALQFMKTMIYAWYHVA